MPINYEPSRFGNQSRRLTMVRVATYTPSLEKLAGPLQYPQISKIFLVKSFEVSFLKISQNL